jgi:non-canonical purine NTP pyrophosphatase (RdgB/HAM1 family)
VSVRRFTGDKLVLATHNKGKAAEIAALLSGHVQSFPTVSDLNLPEPDETENTFIGNAILKACAAAKATGLPALADDSGLAVTALKGAPGIFSARWAGPNKDFKAAMARVQKEMGNAADRSAAFICALAIAWPDGHAEAVEGRLDGTLIWPPRGDKGFGYDPIFVPEGHSQTFGEMPASEKEAISHRARAFAKLVEKIFQ